MSESEIRNPKSEIGEKPLVRRSPQWPAVRRAHLREHPRCEACGSATSVEVHHKVPVHADPAKELDPENLVTLCDGPGRGCHLLFGHLGHWHSWNTTVVRDARRFRGRVIARPFVPASAMPEAEPHDDAATEPEKPDGA